MTHRETSETVEPNRFTLTLPWLLEERVWHPADPTDRPFASYNFPGAFLTAFDALEANRGWTIHVTNRVDRLPSYGDKTIAVVLEDEFARFPLYAPDVRAVFKTYGVSLPFPWPTGRPNVDAMSAVHWAALNRRRARFVLGRRLGRGDSRKNVFDIPLGYYKQLDLPLIPLSQRKWDLTFAGSVEHRKYKFSSPKRYLSSPKVLSREIMIEELASFGRDHPDARIDVRTTASFGKSMESSALEYSESLQHSKICVVPRGASLETYRWYEGMRYGCVVICERLPKRRYYDEAPCLRIRDWKELGPLITRIRNDQAFAERLSRDARGWWERECSEEAVAAFMQRALNDQTSER